MTYKDTGYEKDKNMHQVWFSGEKQKPTQVLSSNFWRSATIILQTIQPKCGLVEKIQPEFVNIQVVLKDGLILMFLKTDHLSGSSTVMVPT